MEAEFVFPTRVGVNRLHPYKPKIAPGFPHTRGGEPSGLMVSPHPCSVFPTRVGVNRNRRIEP